MKKDNENMTTYLIEFENGKKQKITVPESWKVTFGPAVVGGKGAGNRGNYAGKMPMALRFYENGDKQRAIFTNIAGFRDMSIQIEEEKVRVQDKDGFMECDGVRKRTNFRAEVREWVNPDKINEDMPLLPSDKDMF